MVNDRGDIKQHIRALKAHDPVEWHVSNQLIDYQDAHQQMEAHVAAIHEHKANERVWLLQHPPLYTAGTSAQEQDLISPDRFPVYTTGRGGQYTYHGPGQRVAYVMLNLKTRSPDVRAYVAALEDWVIATLKQLGVVGERREDRVGVWIRRPELGPGREDKIAAIGIRVRHWVTFHGISLNVAPKLEHFSGIVPCGVIGHGVTSLSDLGIKAGMNDVDEILAREFENHFGPVIEQ